jgi:hypothetical protein
MKYTSEKNPKKNTSALPGVKKGHETNTPITLP